ncbi:MAG TPA: competence protein [Rhodobacteraceae bacterium]|nr:competence protein [Paracoccaceae bacterium]
MRKPINPLDLILAQRGHLFVWTPVCLAAGIGIYFSLPVEPAGGAYATLSIFGIVLLVAALWLGERQRPLFLAALLVVLGVLLGGARANLVAEPVLTYRYYGPIEGRVVKIDRSGSEKMRLTLDRVALENMPAHRTPSKVRISLHAKQSFITPQLGMLVMTTGHLSPPQGPVEPGGFDFRRMAWFQGLGGIGYSRVPLLMLEKTEKGQAGLFIHRLRMRISSAVQAIVGGDAGAFASAITTGDRSGMRGEVLMQLRASNLAHLLAISGLHMGLLTAFVFAALRYGLALIPVINLRWPVKKIAAVASLFVAAGYLLLSGGNIATERAFIMVSVMLVAILFNRRALSLRAVALAAIIVLIRRPEALTGPGFQMSFAATTALVAVFGALSHWHWAKLPKWLRPVFTVLVSSFIAGAATAPVAAAHFNQIAHYGLLANLLSVPLMGVLVMPAAVIAAVLYPLGLAWVGLAFVRWGALWILGVAEWVAGLEGSLSHVITPMPLVLPLIGLGMLWLILWQGRLRFGGIAVVLIGLLLWGQTQRPTLLISQSGGLIGLLGENGRSFNKKRGDGFAARNWLENDGDGGIDQAEAFRRVGLSGEKGNLRFDLAGEPFVHLTGRGAAERVQQACGQGGWVITSVKYRDDGPCKIFDALSLRKTGAVAVYQKASGLKMVTANDQAGKRIWNGF